MLRAELAAMAETQRQLERQLEVREAAASIGAEPVSPGIASIRGESPDQIALRLQDYLTGRMEEANERSRVSRPEASAFRLRNSSWILSDDAAGAWQTLQFGESMVWIATSAGEKALVPADFSGAFSACLGQPMCVVWDDGSGPRAYHFIERRGTLWPIDCVDYDEIGDGRTPPSDADLLANAGMVAEVRRGTLLCLRAAAAPGYVRAQATPN